KPETLERRYMGKLSKQAINFMKQLLHPEPKMRLKGDAVFNHPYFENYPDPFPSSISNNVVNKVSQNLSSVTTPLNNNNLTSNISNNNDNNMQVINKNILQNISVQANQANTNTALNEPKKLKQPQPIISNTTNIN